MGWQLMRAGDRQVAAFRIGGADLAIRSVHLHQQRLARRQVGAR